MKTDDSWELPIYGSEKKYLTYDDWINGRAVYSLDTCSRFVPSDIPLIREESKRIILQNADEEYSQMITSFNERVQRAHSLKEVILHQLKAYKEILELPFKYTDIDVYGYLRGKDDWQLSGNEIIKLREYYQKYIEGNPYFYFNEYPELINSKWYTLKANAIAIRRYFDFLEKQYEVYEDAKSSTVISSVNILTDNTTSPKNFIDLFINPNDVAPCIEALRKIDPPVINPAGRWIGKKGSKSILVAWIDRLEFCNKIKKISTRRDLVPLLNHHFPNLCLGNDARIFGQTTTIGDNYKLEFASLILP